MRKHEYIYVYFSKYMSFTHERFFSLQDQNIQEPEQRSPEWFERRKGKLSGSKFSQLLFCKTDDDRIRIYEEIFCGRKKEPFPEIAKKYMLWGQENEDTALLSLLNNMPNLIAMEAPMVQHTDVLYLAASPDGFYEDIETGEKGIIEIKCPGKTKLANSKPTYYYVPQMYMEMACSGRRIAIFCSWGTDTCRAWKLHWNDNMWLALCHLIDVFKRTKIDATYENFLDAQYELKKQCHMCVEEALPLSPDIGWLTAQ